jgi:hypothetical protein
MEKEYESEESRGKDGIKEEIKMSQREYDDAQQEHSMSHIIR